MTPAAGSAPAPTLAGLAPGVLLCAAITAAAALLQLVEVRWAGRAWIDALVLALLLGAAVRTVWSPGARWSPGIAFSARTLLEVAVALLGATISAQALAAVGPGLLFGIVATVAVALPGGYLIGRMFGLSPRLATLTACGNAICGNSAIAAAAPVIGAEPDEVAASIGFTAVLGVIVVLALPLIALALDMSAHGFGVLAGLTVYAVPQVLAATAPISTLSAQTGAVVKLVRVLLLGPVVLGLALLTHRRAQGGDRRVWRHLHHFVPWFIVAFLILLAARSFGLIPPVLLGGVQVTATWMTILAMAGLGLGVDVRAVARSGPRVIAAVTLSLALIGVVALALIALLGL